MDNEQKNTTPPPQENPENVGQVSGPSQPQEPATKPPMSTEEKLATSPVVIRPTFQGSSSSDFLNAMNQANQEPLATENNNPEDVYNSTNVDTASPDMFADNVDKKENKLIKFIRILIWLAVAIALPIGISLKKSSTLSSSLADGSYKRLGEWGEKLVMIFLILGCLNLLWGLIRWVARVKRKKCSVGQIIGKLIGGGIWRTLVFTPIVLFSFLVLATSFRESIKENIHREYMPTSSEMIFEAYENEEISTDEYINNLLLASFDSESLPENYKGASETMIPDFARLVEENYDALSDETKLLFYEIFSLSHIDFDLDASGNEEVAIPTPSLFSQNAYAAKSKHSVKTLNKAKLSSSRRFVIFYTDTGRDKISDSDAENIARYLEESAEKYKANFGFDYSYEYAGAGSLKTLSTRRQQNEVLKNSGIGEGVDILKSAMPVYITNPYNDASDAKDLIAFYSGEEYSNLLDRIITDLKSSYVIDYLLKKFGVEIDPNDAEKYDYLAHTLSFPTLTILPDKISGNASISTPAILAHELGHHYQSRYCFTKTGNACKSSDFISEGSANFMSLNTMQFQSTENLLNKDYYNGYLENRNSQGHEVNIDKISRGYRSLAWFENLYEKTKNIDGIMNLLLSSPELETAKNTFGVDILKDVMVSLAERSLTNDYDPAVYLKALKEPSGITLPCSDICDNVYKINYSSSHYIYFSAEEYKEAKISFRGEGNALASLLYKTDIDSPWQILESGKAEIELEVPEESEVFSYAFAVIDYGTSGSSNYRIKVVKGELASIISGPSTPTLTPVKPTPPEAEPEEPEEESIPPEEEPEEPDEEPEEKTRKAPNPFFGEILIDGCEELDTDSLLEIPKMLIGGGSEIAHLVADASEEDLSSQLSELDAEVADFNKNVAEAKKQLSAYRIVLCGTQLKEDVDFSEAKRIIKNVTGGYEIFDQEEEGVRFSGILGVDIATASVKAYVLLTDGTYSGLLTVSVSER